MASTGLFSLGEVGAGARVWKEWEGPQPSCRFSRCGFWLGLGPVLAPWPKWNSLGGDSNSLSSALADFSVCLFP